MRVLIYDTTPQKRNLLDEMWKIGAWFAKVFRRFDHKIGATSWPDALEQLLEISKDRKIHELHYWGHGYWGHIFMGKKAITSVALVEPKHIWHAQLKELATRFTSTSMVWFRVCAAFGNGSGQLFARKVSELFGCRCVASTFIIHTFHAGIHSLKPGDTPKWPVKEGVKKLMVKNPKTGEMEEKEKAKWSWPFVCPNWIMFWTSRIPNIW